MSNDDFLSRWSRRKREAARPVRSPEQPATSAKPGAPPPGDDAAAVPDEASPPKTEDDFDLASLPPIESITAVTDVTAFLRTGVPLELTRAALRRAWESDPAIRDFIGPAENAWDFNDPNAMPGFGPLDQTPEKARELAARIVGRVRQAAEELASVEEESPPPPAAENQSAQSPEQSADPPSSVAVVPRAIERPDAPVTGSIGGSEELSEDAASHKGQLAVKARRNHGRALPR